jgi:hypothetical protein
MAQYAELQEMYFKNVFVSLYQISLKLRLHGTRKTANRMSLFNRNCYATMPTIFVSFVETQH